MISAGNLLITNGSFNQNLVASSRGFELLSQRVATQARYDSGEVSDPAKCHPDTRVAILNDLEEWADSPTYNYPIKWISGSAGVGKTAIMRTTAEKLEQRNLLLAGFFFWRTGNRCNSAEFFIATIAYQIALSIPATRPYIERAVEENPHIFTQNLEVQSRALIVDPITSVYRGQALPSNYPRILLIDGLDECLDAKKEAQDIEKQCEVLNTLQWTLRQLPAPFALLIASRPEYHIQSMFDTTLKGVSSLVLNDLPYLDADIERFYADKFREIREHHPLRSYLPSPEWPSSVIIDFLVSRVSGQFIYASTVMKFLTARKKNPANQLDAILDAELRGNVRPFQPLDILYSTIFSTIDEEDLSAALRVLGVLFMGRSSNFSFNAPARFWDLFLGLKQGEVERLMLGLESVLSIKRPEGLTFWFYHASLGEFLFDSMRSRSFFINKSLVYEDLAKQSIFHLSTTDDHVRKFIMKQMNYWFSLANPSMELHLSIEQAQISIRPQDLKFMYPVFLEAIQESSLPDKESLYSIQLDGYRTHLKQIIPLYFKDESLVFLILVCVGGLFFQQGHFFELFIDRTFPLSAKSKRMDREQGLYLYGDASYSTFRPTSTDTEIFRHALEDVINELPEAGNWYSRASSILVKSREVIVENISLRMFYEYDWSQIPPGQALF